MKVWLSQERSQGLVDRAFAQVSPFDHGLTVGDGIFETLKVRNGQAFALRRHLERLERSAQVLGITGCDVEEIRHAVAAVIEANPTASALGRLRITMTSGEGPMASDRHDSASTLIVALVPMDAWPATTSAILTPWKRNEYSPIAGAKSTSYAENVVALSWARERGFSEGLFTAMSGHISEGTGSNIFLVLNGELVTPSLASGCLAGITRDLVIEWFEAKEREVTLDEFLSADEVFLTSSTRDVHPLHRLNDRTWNHVGPITERVASTFHSRCSLHSDP